MPIGPHFELAPRERQLAPLLAKRLTVTSVAQKLGIPVSTARTHVKNTLRKTKTHTVPALARWAKEHTACCPGSKAG